MGMGEPAGLIPVNGMLERFKPMEYPEGGGKAQDQNKFCYNYECPVSECPQAVG